MEAIMKIETPLHTDHQLDQLAGQFEHWRQTRAHSSERIPQPLWDQAAALARVLPHTRVAHHLRLSSNDLKKQMAKQAEAGAVAPAPTTSFVEVPTAPASFQPSSPTEIDIERPDGARLRLVCSETPLPLATVVRAFLEAP
jgi:hypothetical protein